MTSDEFLEEAQKLPNIKIISDFAASILYVKITETASVQISSLHKSLHCENNQVSVLMPDEDKIYEYIMELTICDNFDEVFRTVCTYAFSNVPLQNANVKDVTLQEVMQLIIEAIKAYTNLYAKCKKAFLVKKLENI